MWIDEFNLNTLRVDEEIFESGKKKLQIQKYLDMCGRGPKENHGKIPHGQLVSIKTHNNIQRLWGQLNKQLV